MNSPGKKLLPVVLAAFLAVFFIPKPTQAVSGCCSGHDGVCCECGAQASGKVICNDGWLGSSCLYSEMVMCGGVSVPVYEPPPPTSTPIPLPTNTPTPIPVVRLTSTPTPVPTATPTPKPTPTTKPTDTPAPTKTPTDNQNNEPEITPEVKGVSDNDLDSSSGETLGALGSVGFAGWGGYKLLRKFLAKKVVA